MSVHGIIHNDDLSWVLADTEEEAVKELVDAGYCTTTVEPAGWMMSVPFPFEYGSREEWEASPDFQESWWESCGAPLGTTDPTLKVCRAWEILGE